MEEIYEMLDNKIVQEIVYHYTDLKSLIGILEKKSLWFSHITALYGDRFEFGFGIDRIINSLLKIDNNKIHEELLNSFGEALKAGKTAPICVGSFCEKRDLPSQWKKFCKNGPAVAIGFRTKDLYRVCDNEGFVFGKCIYENALQCKCVLKLASQVREDRKVDGNWFDLLKIYFATSACFFKREEGYEEEYEVRIVTHPSITIDKRIKDGLETNYYSLNLLDDNESFFESEIIIGPNPNPTQIQEEIESILVANKIENYKITFSDMP